MRLILFISVKRNVCDNTLMYWNNDVFQGILMPLCIGKLLILVGYNIQVKFVDEFKLILTKFARIVELLLVT